MHTLLTSLNKNIRRYALAIVLICWSIIPRGVWAGSLVDSIIVAGQVTNIPADGSRTLIINECDPDDSSQRRIVTLESDGCFNEQIPFSFGHTFTVNYTRQLFVNAYAEPGDSVYVTVDASASPLEFHLSGYHSDLNDQYSHIRNAMSLSDINLPSDTTPYQQYIESFRREVDRKNRQLKQYIGKNLTDSIVAEMLRSDILYGIANQALSYKGNDIEDKRRFFTDSIFEVFNDKHTRVMIYPYHLQVICNRFPEYIDSVPKGIVRDIMYAILKDQMPVRPDRTDFSNPRYYDRIFGSCNPRIIDLDIIPEGDFTVFRGDSVQAVNNSNILDWLAGEYAGRPIYFDISATWCGPCRAAIAGGEPTRNHFKDRAPVFVILWLKSDMEEWRKIAPAISNAVQIFVDNDSLADYIMGALNVRGFPSYRFIGRDGDIFPGEIPSFNSPELIDFLLNK